jgi:hypothetical protein
LVAHISKVHTEEAIKKRSTEDKMAVFFTSEGITFDRDRANFVSFADCPDHEKFSEEARCYFFPDFYLLEITASLSCHVLVGNDEMEHRRYRCDFSRTLDIYNLVTYNDDFENPLPMVYIRVNPHFYRVLKANGQNVKYTPKIEEGM